MLLLLLLWFYMPNGPLATASKQHQQQKSPQKR